MTTPRTVVDESLPITRVVVIGDLNTERVVVDVEDQPRIAVSNTGEDITVNIYSSAAGVNSVNGLQGDVTLTSSNVSEGSNLYYTTARVNSAVDTRLATKTTSDLAEGSNQYFTTARARSAISAGNNITITNGVISTVTEPDFTTVTVTEAPTDNYHVTNKAYVDSQVSSISAPTSTDDLPEGSINEYYTNARSRAAISASGSLSYNSSTGVISYTTPSTIASLANHSTTDLAEGTNLYYTDARVATKVESYGYATEGYVGTQIANLVDSSPATLDTLNELANALGDDPNFATTVSTALGTKLATADFTSTANTWLATKNTDAVTEGSTNLYYTNARADARIAAASIDALSDVVITTGTAGQMLYYNGTAWVNSVTVDSANISRFARTVAGTSNNVILELSRNRADAARATDNGPWLGFGYVGTDNTQATAGQNAIRSMYDSAGNHKLQFMQIPGAYTTPTPMAQIQRGNTFFNTTTGVANLFLSDTIARIGGTTTTITNSANSATYATFVSGSTVLGSYASMSTGGSTFTVSGINNFVRTGTTNSTQPALLVRYSRTDTTGSNDGDGVDFRLGTGGTSTTNNIARFDAQYRATGLHTVGISVSTDSFAADTDTVYRAQADRTTIRATPAGGGTASDILTVEASKVTMAVPVAFPLYTVTAARALSGSAGWQICISNSAQGSNPNGMMAFWDTSNSRWSYIHDNSAV